jgi:hypothetical protein
MTASAWKPIGAATTLTVPWPMGLAMTPVCSGRPSQLCAKRLGLPFRRPAEWSISGRRGRAARPNGRGGERDIDEVGAEHGQHSRHHAVADVGEAIVRPGGRQRSERDQVTNARAQFVEVSKRVDRCMTTPYPASKQRRSVASNQLDT